MLQKEPKPSKLGKNVGFKVFIAVEFGLLCGSFILWQNLNTSADFRYKMHNKYPSLLNGFYYVDNKFGDGCIKRHDYKKWGISR